MMMLMFSVLALATAQPEAAQPNPEETKCDLKGHLAILLDPTVDRETFEVFLRTTMEAALAFDLTKSKVGIWQMTQPPTLELAMGPTNHEDLIKKFMVIEQGDTSAQLEGAVESMNEAAKSLVAKSPNQIDQESGEKGNTILYAAGSRKDGALLQAAEDIREQGIAIRAIAVGMKQEDVEDLFAMTGADNRVLQLPSDAKDTSGRVTDFVCQKSSGIGTQDDWKDWWCKGHSHICWCDSPHSC